MTGRTRDARAEVALVLALATCFTALGFGLAVALVPPRVVRERVPEVRTRTVCCGAHCQACVDDCPYAPVRMKTPVEEGR